MKKGRSVFVLAAAMMMLSASAFGWHDYTKSGGLKPKPTKEVQAKAADCAPATERINIDLNKVRALIETGGSMWQNRATGDAAYFVPKPEAENDPATTAIYAGALWMGGIDINGQLKLAAVTFRANGNDFWAGPLTVTAGSGSGIDPNTGVEIRDFGPAEVDPDVCLAYDRFFEITRQEVDLFNAWWEAGEFDAANNTNTQAENFPGYDIPEIISTWPAHGDVSAGQDFYLAPFYDRDGDGVYNPAGAGDYPWYDIKNEIDCRSATDRRVTLFGDHTFWWVFNDKGNIHTETGSDPIGMEIKAQGFAFATNDEINSMTFYNYEMINRGTQTLFDTYFGQWVDADLGCSDNDYVGCDVARGLGYTYNGEAVDNDCNGATGYGTNPPAIAVDFFEGPYQDNDGIDNAFGIGPNEALNGIGYGDAVADNERFGMRRFLYYNRSGQGNPAQQDPNVGIDYYNYLRGIWLDGTKFVYGGSAHLSDPDADPNIECDFMFPGDSDPLSWGTGGQPVADWSEQSAGNVPFDRRFMQSAGPFTLLPGAVNNITVGVVYARATTGDPFASVEAVRVADDKAQSLFQECFRVLDGPDAPTVSIQELDRELILTLSNPPSSNNANESYLELDPIIPENVVETVTNYVFDTATQQYNQVITTQTITYDRYYRFQGYQIFQVKDASVGPADVLDADLSRLVAQVDVKDDVTQLINYEFNDILGTSVPTEMVDGVNEGIGHSFKITEDFFAQGERTLINHKTYYYMAIAYGYNNYKTFDPTDGAALDGQKKPYKAGRKSPFGAITAVGGIPHITSPELGGTVANSAYGDGVEITRIEGQGNGSLILDFTEASEASIVSNWRMSEPTYKAGQGPINVKIIDPLNVPEGRFRLSFLEDNQGDLDSSMWYMIPQGDITTVDGSKTYTSLDTFFSDQGITLINEQLFPEFGFSVAIEQYQYRAVGADRFTEFIEATVTYADSSRQWLTGIGDIDGFSPLNWIRSGTSEETMPPNDIYNDYLGIDDDQVFEGILGGSFAPWRLVADEPGGPVGPNFANTISMPDIADVHSIDIVVTSDRSKWTRCGVIETQEDNVLAEGGADKSSLREAPSVDKSGRSAGDPGYNAAEGDLNGTTGMGWFPGYAVDLETGERLNMAFGEDSWQAGENGRDMLWNPGTRVFSDVVGGDAGYLMGGKHYIYVYNNDRRITGDQTRMPSYDQGEFLNTNLNGSNGQKIKVWRSTMWVGLPLTVEGQDFLSNDVRVRIRVKKPYETYDTQTGNAQNDWRPMYEFGTEGLGTETGNAMAADTALELINIVPNPYYAYNNYEVSRLDTRVKIVNLPQTCTIKIYNISGTLVRTYSKDSPQTYVDWDLKNEAQVPIAGGVYIVHVDVPDVGEKVVKWFGALRPTDVNNF